MLSSSSYRRLIDKDHHSPEDLQDLLDPVGLTLLEELALRSREITRRRFGNTLTLYAPLYLSNACVNRCVYCGFNTTHRFERVTLDLDAVDREARALGDMGFAHVLLLTGEAPGVVPPSFIAEAVARVKRVVPQVSVEVYPMAEEEYRLLVAAGCDGITVYQETYDRERYATVHLAGPKRDFDKRYQTPMAAARAGMRSVGLGFLIGLAPFREEMMALAKQGQEVLKADWRVRLAFSFPRLRPHEGGFAPSHPVSDQELAQMIFSLRLVFPDAELVLSTRESPAMRDGLMTLGITRMSAGSSTQPGGYSEDHGYGEQFAIDDERTPAQMVQRIRDAGLDPVWKDWDWAFHDEEHHGRQT